ncbi:MAG: hypothetical protein ABR607_14405 [Pyrinomonadaceae bacterium]
MPRMMAILVALCFLIGGISYMGKGNTTVKAGVKEDKPDYETRVYIRRQCFLSRTSPREVDKKFIGPLAAIFVPVLIEKALGGLAGALKKAGAEETLRDSGQLPTYLYRLMQQTVRNKGRDEVKHNLELNPDLGCVLVVRGLFANREEEAPANTVFARRISTEDSDAATNERIRLLNDNGIHVTQIAVLYEAEIDFAEDKTALRYTSRFLQVNDFQGDRSHQRRAMVITVAITGAGQKEGEPLLSLVMVNLGQVSKNTVLGPEDLRNKRSSWVGGLAISDASLAAIATIQFPPPKPGETRAYVQIMPVTVEGVIAETDEGSKALRFIADVLDSTKADVSKTLSAEILKDRGKEKQEAADAVEKLRGDEEGAYAAFLDAKADRAKLKNPTAEEIAAADFKVEATRRAWCLKLNAAQRVGVEVSRPYVCPQQ